MAQGGGAGALVIRRERVAALQSGASFDLLVIGGGATGLGTAVDAASRGLKVALVERQDYAEGTSSRATKLLHGGVRYLEAAVRHLDRGHFKLVLEALHERGRVIANAPHLSRRLEMVTPLYDWMSVPYVWAGLKLYDLLSGKRSIGHSRLLSREETLRRLPGLRRDGLKAGMLYYDGQFVDSRLAIALMRTARAAGATLLNHVEVTALTHAKGKISGAELHDLQSDARWKLKARAVINATGPFADRLRKLDDRSAKPILRVSAGAHIVVDRRFLPGDTGLLVPKTDDGRVLFILPWENHALIGTTDDPTQLADHPKVREADVAYLLDYARRYFDVRIGEEDILSRWSGIRPLAHDREEAGLAQLSRDHLLAVGKSGMVTISGGKWTTYRLMAQQAVDSAIAGAGLPAAPCRTEDLKLFGAYDFDADGADALIERFALPEDVAKHLNATHGDQAAFLLEEGGATGRERIHPRHPYIVSELLYAMRQEDAIHAIDLLARRLTMAMVDAKAAAECGDKVIAMMARELGWDRSRQHFEKELLTRRLSEAL
jgi:glycerol-3-phosphate dehydrogenase